MRTIWHSGHIAHKQSISTCTFITSMCVASILGLYLVQTKQQQSIIKSYKTVCNHAFHLHVDPFSHIYSCTYYITCYITCTNNIIHHLSAMNFKLQQKCKKPMLPFVFKSVNFLFNSNT